MLWDKDQLSYPCLASGFRYLIGIDIKPGTYYLLIVVGRPIADETPTKKLARFLPKLSTKWGEALLLSIKDSPALK